MTQAVKLAQLGSPGISTGFKNRIINGAMMIDQRNAGASGTASAFTIDRWGYSATQSSKGTWQQNAGSVTPPSGFTNYWGFTSSSAYSVTSSDQFYFYQGIEGYNLADMGFGASGASTFTISFWVRSSLTGTFGASVQNSAQDRSYPFSYTISAANTWEQKTVTIAGDTSGTWLKTNGCGMYLLFGLGVGSTFSGTAGAWAGSNFVSATGATSVVGTNGATFYITGVQLEVGTTATDFEYREYGTELAMCQRYFETSFNGAALASNTDNGGIIAFNGSAGSTTTSFIGQAVAQYRVTKRTAPTITLFDLAIPRNSGALTRYQLGVSNNNNQNATLSDNGTSGFTVYSTGSAGASGILFHYTSSAEL